MKKLTLDEMKEISGGLGCYKNLKGCNANGDCCITTHCSGGFSDSECGSAEWYFNQQI